MLSRSVTAVEPPMDTEVSRYLREVQDSAHQIKSALSHIPSNPTHAGSLIRSRVNRLEDSLTRLKRAIERRESEIDD